MSEKRERAFCIEDGEFQTYAVRAANKTITVRGISFTYLHRAAYCDKCGMEIYVPAVNDANAQAREDAYKSASTNT